MKIKYDSLFLSEKQLKDNLHLQVVAKFRPERFNIPDGFIPKSQIDKIIFKIMKRGSE